MNLKIATRRASLLLLLFMLCAITALAQTSVFTYQGRLTDGGTAANGNYDLQFALFDTGSGGTQIGAQTSPNVSVSAGIFSVQLDFGATAFPGANRFLEISARLSGGGSFTTLSPRQPITSTPYAIRSANAANADTATTATNATTATTAANATQLGGVAANQYLQTNGNGSGLTNLNAGNITTGTLNSARLGLIPTANIADSAVTATKIASGQVVKSLNTLKDDVTLAAGSNITITPAGNTLTIASTSGGVGGSGTINTIPVWSGGSTLGNSGITQSSGNVGIGTTAPTSKLEIAAQDGLKISGFQPFLTLRDTNGGKSSFVQGVNGDAALLTDSRATLIVKDISGNVGIGTTAPALLSGGSGKLVSISDSLNPGIALTNTGARQFFLYSAGGSGSFRVFDATSSADRFTIDNVGNAKQERGTNGLVKAMIFVNADGTIRRCYNSTLPDGGASLPPSGMTGCGFSTANQVPNVRGDYLIDFHFKVNDRFFSLTIGQIFTGAANTNAERPSIADSQLEVFTTDSTNHLNGAPFCLIVY
jgi:hypothetical protein